MRSLKQIIRGIFSVRQHLIMMLDLNEVNMDKPFEDLILDKIDKDEDFISGTYTVEMQKKIISRNEGFVETYILKLRDESIGITSVMYRGGNELEYKVRTIDAFIYNVLVDVEYRGNGYAQIMLILLAEKLKKKGVSNAYLAVSIDNKNAIDAYEKTGFKTVGKRMFVRILRHNIPYYSL